MPPPVKGGGFVRFPLPLWERVRVRGIGYDMDKKIKIKITSDGKVEIDSTVFNDCKDVANHLTRLLGMVEKFDVKDETEAEAEERIKIKADE